MFKYIKSNTFSEIYRDDYGIMGEVGSTWTIKELRKYWDSDHMYDPVLSEYDSFSDWLDDTLSNMTRL